MARMIMALLFLIPAMALAADDPIKAELDQAQAEHAESLAAAATRLVAAMEARLQEVAGKGSLDNTKEIKLQKELFEKDRTLPRTPLLARAKTDYESDVRAATEGLRKALEKAKADYTKAIKLEEAEAVAAELKQLADGTPAKKGTAANEAEPTVIATWAHQVRTGKDAIRSTFKLYSNGKINSPKGRATWQVKGGFLILTWPDAKAPGGAWTDVCNLAKDGKSYRGKNNEGAPIFGAKLASGEVDTDKKK